MAVIDIPPHLTDCGARWGQGTEPWQRCPSLPGRLSESSAGTGTAGLGEKRGGTRHRDRQQGGLLRGRLGAADGSVWGV